MTHFQIPAICTACGLMFPCGARVRFGGKPTFFMSNASCPRCSSFAYIPSGAFEVFQDSVRFFSSAAFTEDVRLAIELAARDYLRDPKIAPAAIKAVRQADSRAGELFHKWVATGSIFVGAMASVAMAVFAYYEHRGRNLPVEEVAVSAFEEIYETAQPDLRVLRPKPRPMQVEGHGKAQTKNRKQRRTERALNRRDQNGR